VFGRCRWGVAIRTTLILGGWRAGVISVAVGIWSLNKVVESGSLGCVDFRQLLMALRRARQRLGVDLKHNPDSGVVKWQQCCRGANFGRSAEFS
jgi:hypothetical protein